MSAVKKKPINDGELISEFKRFVFNFIINILNLVNAQLPDVHSRKE